MRPNLEFNPEPNSVLRNNLKKEKSELPEGRENYGYVKVYGHFQGRI